MLLSLVGSLTLIFSTTDMARETVRRLRVQVIFAVDLARMRT